MKVKTRDAGKVHILALQGNINFSDGDEDLARAVKQTLTEGRKRIVLNLSDVTFMDSSGLGQMAASSKRASDQQAIIKLVIPPSIRVPLIVLSHLRMMFEAFEDEVRAVASFVD